VGAQRGQCRSEHRPLMEQHQIPECLTAAATGRVDQGPDLGLFAARSRRV